MDELEKIKEKILAYKHVPQKPKYSDKDIIKDGTELDTSKPLRDNGHKDSASNGKAN